MFALCSLYCDCDFADGLSVSFGDVLVSHAAGERNSAPPDASALSQALARTCTALSDALHALR